MFPRLTAGSFRRPLSLLLLAALSPLGALAQAPAAAPPASSDTPQAPSIRPPPPVAPTPSNARAVSLAEALTLAMRQSPDVAAARAQAAVARAGVQHAWTAWQPELTANGQYVHTNVATQFDLSLITEIVGGVFNIPPVHPEYLSGPVVISAKDSRYATLQLSQPFFTPAGALLIAPARRGAESAELGALEAREQVLLAVARTYLGLQGIVQLMEAAHEAEAVALQRESEAKAQLDVGVTVEASLLRAQTETAQARVQLAQLSGQYAQLTALLGALVSEPIQPLPLGAASPQWDIPSADKDPWENTYGVRAAALAVRASEGKVTYDRFSWLPSIVGQARYLYNSNLGFTGVHDTYELSVAASLPLYDRGARYAALSEDEARLAQARAQYESARARAQANWVAAQANLEAAQAALMQAEAQAQLAARVQQQVAASYKAGVVTNLEMSDADNRRFLAASNAAQARASLEIRRVELVAAAGRIAASLEK